MLSRVMPQLSKMSPKIRDELMEKTYNGGEFLAKCSPLLSQSDALALKVNVIRDKNLIKGVYCLSKR